MTLVEKFMSIAFVLIILGLVLKNAGAFNTAVSSLGTNTSGVISTLQAG